MAKINCHMKTKEYNRYVLNQKSTIFYVTSIHDQK